MAILQIIEFFFQQIFNKDLRDGLNKLRVIQREAERNNGLYNGDFFRGILSSKGKKGIINVYIDGLPSKSQKEKRIFILNAVNKSYLLIGDSGCGKSTFLHQDYIQHPFTLINRTLPLINLYNYFFTFSLFLSANQIMDLDDERIQEIKDNYAFSRIKHTILYLDGLDELGNQYTSKKDLIIKLINLMKIADKCEVKISCRPNFAIRNNNFKDLFTAEKFPGGYEEYEIDYWDSATLSKIAENVLKNKNLNETIKNQSDEIRKKAKKWKKSLLIELSKRPSAVFRNAPSFDKCLINSPLALMLFLYINLFTKDDISLSKKLSKYELYEKFINAIGESEGASSHKLEEEKKILSKIFFEHFVKPAADDSERISKSKLSGVNYLLKLIKKQIDSEDREISFIHYSFFDFFIAYYYQLIILDEGSDTKSCVKVLGEDYQNDVADFITDVIELKKPNDIIATKMYSIYSSLLPIRSDKNLTINTFLAKKEIAFRLGRMDYSSKQERENVSNFLKEKYYNDDKTFAGDTDRAFHLAMLKRWLAISGSLLNTEAGEEIELDYIKKMICNPKENNLEDLANRSQTLVFYGDVPDVSALDYRDDNPSTVCATAIRKRINRLLNINDKASYELLNSELNPRELALKSYCFRAFDLASIYCLLRFHYGSNKLFVEELRRLNPKLKIKDIRVIFENANPEREKIMKLLIDALSNKTLPEKIILN